LGNEDIPIYYVSLAGFNFLTNKDDADHLKEIILSTGSRLIFIDALDDIMAGGDENSVKDIQPVFMALRKVCEETHSSIVLIHHTNKQEGYRGSSAIPGAVDTMVKVESKEGSQSIKLKTEKNRDGKPIDLFAEIQWEQDNYYITEGKATPFDGFNDREEKVLDYMRSNDDEIVIMDFLRTVPSNEEKKFRNAITNLVKKR
jgi:RecA-family ATPase